MRKVLVLFGLAFVSFAGMARAQEGAPVVAEPTVAPAGDPAAPAVAAPAGYPDEYALRPLGVAAGMVEVLVPVEIELSKGMVAKPINIPLEVRYGLSEQLELKLFHLTGLCLTGKEKGCTKVYNDVGLGVAYSFLKNSELELAAMGGLLFSNFSDLAMDANVGLGVKYIAGAIGVNAAPQMWIALNKRDKRLEKDALWIPVQVAYQVNPQLAPFVRTGIFGPTDHFGDMYTIPLGVGANYLLQHGLDLGAAFTLTSLVSGVSGNKALDSRELLIYAAWRNL